MTTAGHNNGMLKQFYNVNKTQPAEDMDKQSTTCWLCKHSGSRTPEIFVDIYFIVGCGAEMPPVCRQGKELKYFFIKLTPWSIVVLEKLMVPTTVKKQPHLSWTQKVQYRYTELPGLCPPPHHLFTPAQKHPVFRTLFFKNIRRWTKYRNPVTY
jgi:hypothetical protein